MVRTIGKLAGRRQSETILPNKQPNEHQEEVGLLPALHLKQLYHLFLPWAADHYLKRTLMTTLQIQPVILPLPQPRKQKQKLQKYQKSKLKSQARCLVLPVSHYRFKQQLLVSRVSRFFLENIFGILAMVIQKKFKRLTAGNLSTLIFIRVNISYLWIIFKIISPMFPMRPTKLLSK